VAAREIVRGVSLIALTVLLDCTAPLPRRFCSTERCGRHLCMRYAS